MKNLIICVGHPKDFAREWICYKPITTSNHLLECWLLLFAFTKCKAIVDCWRLGKGMRGYIFWYHLQIDSCFLKAVVYGILFAFIVRSFLCSLFVLWQAEMLSNGHRIQTGYPSFYSLWTMILDQNNVSKLSTSFIVYSSVGEVLSHQKVCAIKWEWWACV